MTSIEQLEDQIRGLSREELVQLRDFISELDWEAWDQELEEDAASGKLDDLAREALDDSHAGRTREI